ncbi:N-acetylmuramoyl-L-alanine amidase [Lachnotalea glycerini]|uniref:N-acetylmuramoyl-L-alanine amidase n=1 Tax=Lachnotalea glycerini TaxID=1763509 RepID=A0A255IM30_9FIRM|nr:peptidoglycan recognition family protein [Lachnotalea glycerini]PXV89366.1 N-acetylmuramoyl-L-alanine amidase [Lachnotalea glycerini]RDY30752.1 N-acetylmuramoyl-L-alanine amidase [Lachnotalea glycerini]
MYNRRKRDNHLFGRIKLIAIISTIILVCLSYYGIIKKEILELPSKEIASAAVVKVSNTQAAEEETANEIETPDWITEDFVDVNEYSRPGKKLEAVNAVVIHYTGNPGTTAAQHRHYYGELATTKEASVSSNFVVGIEGEVIECVPMDEVAYASNERNSDTLSIEVCHKDKTGKFTDASYESVVKLTAFLCEKFNLGEDQIIRHYDVTGKKCPKYYVEHEDEWLQLKKDVMESVKTDSWKQN